MTALWYNNSRSNHAKNGCFGDPVTPEAYDSRLPETMEDIGTRPGRPPHSGMGKRRAFEDGKNDVTEAKETIL